MIVGVAREILPSERRVALISDSLAALKKLSIDVMRRYRSTRIRTPIASAIALAGLTLMPSFCCSHSSSFQVRLSLKAVNSAWSKMAVLMSVAAIQSRL